MMYIKRRKYGNVLLQSQLRFIDDRFIFLDDLIFLFDEKRKMVDFIAFL